MTFPSTTGLASSQKSNGSGGFVTHIECSKCGTVYLAGKPLTVCSKEGCGKPLFVRYDLEKIRKSISKEDFQLRTPSLWRYREVLPVSADENVITLGEGFTPLLHAKRLGNKYGLPTLYIKDEAVNPTGSFKARGLCMAVSMAKELGFQKLAIPSAGNAAGALSAYAARGGMEANIFMPQDTPNACITECKEMGANVTLVDGLITDCGAIVGKLKQEKNWFDVSTLKEPYRVEGKKTMGYELAEQLQWKLPDAILYPTGGGTGLVGMWKAFDEMEKLGWIDSQRPKMISVQVTGCCPVVTAFHAGAEFAAEHQNAKTVASGLRVPRAIGDFIMLDLIRKSNGTAIAVSDEEMIAANRELSSTEGIFSAPEGGACIAALKKLINDRTISNSDRVVIFNTGSGLKYLEAFNE